MQPLYFMSEAYRVTPSSRFLVPSSSVERRNSPSPATHRNILTRVPQRALKCQASRLAASASTRDLLVRMVYSIHALES